eukprot:9492708-Pyramimonas_sp.AAC.1
MFRNTVFFPDSRILRSGRAGPLQRDWIFHALLQWAFERRSVQRDSGEEEVRAAACCDNA